jgi:NADH:ubiquinone reductase (H+-translocating)
MARQKRVVVVGAGFAGLAVARGLEGAPCEVLVLDRSNHHLFQPLLYQVATAGLSPAEIASPIRGLVSGNRHAQVLMQEVVGIDRAQHVVRTRTGEHAYDFLVLATGANHSYFGKDQWEVHAPGLKSLAQATEIRRRVLSAFERAEAESDPETRAAWLTFVVVGAGPTGVELAGAIAELSRYTLARDFRAIAPERARIHLVEAGSRILPQFDSSLAERAALKLRRLGVEVHTGQPVTEIDAEHVAIAGSSAPVKTHTVLWAAGVRASPLGALLGASVDRAGRVQVQSDLRLMDDRQVFVIGDMAAAPDGKGGTLPGLAPVAIQEGRYVAQVLMAELHGRDVPDDFRYFDKGTMATVGRNFAIAQVGPIKLAGALAWFAWLFVHLMYLVGFRNRVLVLFNWAYSYFRFARGARLIVPREWRLSEPVDAKAD